MDRKKGTGEINFFLALVHASPFLPKLYVTEIPIQGQAKLGEELIEPTCPRLSV